MVEGPNPLRVAWSVTRSLLTVRPPGPFGTAEEAHEDLEPVLRRLSQDGVEVLDGMRSELDRYIERRAAATPSGLSRDQSLAYWINLYNAGALQVAAQARRAGEDSVLGVPGGFSEQFVTVENERLSLDDIEHGKIRRFQDPRIHAALVCGSVSCPTLRGEPYEGEHIEKQLDDQMRNFLVAGGWVTDRDERTVHLSRVFLWFGGDFARPWRMPTFFLARRKTVLTALTQWLDSETAGWINRNRPGVRFQDYDWGLSCDIR